MKHFLAVAALVLFSHAVRAESFTARIQETVVVEIPGATAAYTTNPLIADVTTIAPGRLSLTGHSSGTTQLIVITSAGPQSYLITIAAAALPSNRPEAGVPVTRYEGHYSSGAARLQNTIDVVTADEKRRSELYVLHTHDLHSSPGQSGDAIASAFYRRTTPGGELTILDELVDVSRLTISNEQIRGFHLRQGPLELHGGYASSALYDDFFLPTVRRWVGGAGYDIDRGSTRWTPSIYGFFSEPSGTAARRGVVAALTAEHREGDTLFLRGDIGASRSIAAAGEMRYVSSRSQFRALLSLKPDDFPNLGLSDIPGRHAQLDWSSRATDRLSLTSYGSYDQLNLASVRQTFAAASVGFRYTLSRHLAFLTGEDISDIRTSAASIRTVGVPAGLTWESARYGLGATYRLLDSSGASRRGDSIRLDAHAGSGRFSTNAWAERQRQAPTLELIFQADPDLQLALLRLGISVRTPEDVARALRDNAALVDLGIITGVQPDLTPRHRQAGFNIGWLGSGQRSDHLRLLAVYDSDEGISITRESMIATLIYSRRILDATDLYGAGSWFRTTLASGQQSGSSLELGLRQQFSGRPGFMQRGGTIEGFVFLDPEMRGTRGPLTQPLTDIAVTLDGNRTTRTDGRGAYAFQHVPAGAHHIAALLPESPRAFFTTPSPPETKAPAHVDFGVVRAAARIEGRVLSDAGQGITGVVFTAAGKHGEAITATSDVAGRFVFAVPPGRFRVALQTESLPPGYSATQAREREIAAEADLPQSISFEVMAVRSVGGRAPGATEVQIESLGRKAPVDAAGNFVFRSMPAGAFTITARSGGRTMIGTVTLPPEPAVIRDVVLGAPPGTIASVAHPATAKEPAVRRAEPSKPAAIAVPAEVMTGSHVVQAGAFREEQNARELMARLERSGEQPFLVASGGLTHVYIGPFKTRWQAISASERLRREGFDTFVRRR